MRQNLGKLDRVLRFALAVWWLGAWAPVYDANWANLATAVIGWIALLESFSGWCGLHRIFSINNTNQ